MYRCDSAANVEKEISRTTEVNNKEAACDGCSWIELMDAGKNKIVIYIKLLLNLLSSKFLKYF